MQVLHAEQGASVKVAETSRQDPAVPAFVVGWKGPDDGTWIQVFSNKYQAVNPRPQTSTFTVLEDRTYPKIAAQRDGSIVAVWQALDGRPRKPGDVKAQRYTNAGDKVGPEITVAKSDRLLLPALTALPRDRYIVAWSGENKIWIRKFDKELRSIEEARVVMDLDTQPTYLSVASMKDGSVFLAWRDGNGDRCPRETKTAVYLLALDAEGQPQGRARKLADSSACYPAAELTGPEIAAVANDKAVVTWWEGNVRSVDSEDIVAVLSDREGRVLDRPFRVNEPTPRRVDSPQWQP